MEYQNIGNSINLSRRLTSEGGVKSRIISVVILAKYSAGFMSKSGSWSASDSSLYFLIMAGKGP